MRNIQLSLLLTFVFLVSPVWAETKIAVPDFELLDLTMKLTDPDKVAEINAQEQEKLRTIESLLRDGLSNTEGYTLVTIDTEARNAADKSEGYLFDCASCSAELGSQHDADYIVIGRHHKPTYLFSYLIVRVFDSHSSTLVKEFRSEIKGNPQFAIPGAVGNLIHKIKQTLPVSK